MPTDCLSVFLLHELLLVSAALIQIGYMRTADTIYLVQILKTIKNKKTHQLLLQFTKKTTRMFVLFFIITCLFTRYCLSHFGCRTVQLTSEKLCVRSDKV